MNETLAKCLHRVSSRLSKSATADLKSGCSGGSEDVQGLFDETSARQKALEEDFARIHLLLEKAPKSLTISRQNAIDDGRCLRRLASIDGTASQSGRMTRRRSMGANLPTHHDVTVDVLSTDYGDCRGNRKNESDGMDFRQKGGHECAKHFLPQPSVGINNHPSHTRRYTSLVDMRPGVVNACGRCTPLADDISDNQWDTETGAADSLEIATPPGGRSAHWESATSPASGSSVGAGGCASVCGVGSGNLLEYLILEEKMSGSAAMIGPSKNSASFVDVIGCAGQNGSYAPMAEKRHDVSASAPALSGITQSEKMRLGRSASTGHCYGEKACLPRAVSMGSTSRATERALNGPADQSENRIKAAVRRTVSTGTSSSSKLSRLSRALSMGISAGGNKATNLRKQPLRNQHSGRQKQQQTPPHHHNRHTHHLQQQGPHSHQTSQTALKQNQQEQPLHHHKDVNSSPKNTNSYPRRSQSGYLSSSAASSTEPLTYVIARQLERRGIHCSLPFLHSMDEKKKSGDAAPEKGMTPYNRSLVAVTEALTLDIGSASSSGKHEKGHEELTFGGGEGVSWVDVVPEGSGRRAHTVSSQGV